MTTPAAAATVPLPQPPTVEQALAALQRLADAAALAPLPFAAHQAGAAAVQVIDAALRAPRLSPRAPGAAPSAVMPNLRRQQDETP